MIDFQGGTSRPQFNVAPSSVRPITDATNSRVVEVEILRRRLAAAPADKRDSINALLQAELGKRRFAESLFRQVVLKVAGAANVDLHMSTRLPVTNFACVQAATTAFHANCMNLGQNSFALEYAMSFVSMCESAYTTESITAAVQAVCQKVR